MKKFNGYESATKLTERKALPVNGYVLKILDIKEAKYDWGEVLQIRFDIAEGEYKDFYKNDYASQTQEDKKWKGTYRLTLPKDDGSEKDNWTMRVFKTAMLAIEESNPGYRWNWDEQSLKGKIVGAVFQSREWEMNGKSGFYTACHAFKPADDIRRGDFFVPSERYLKKDAPVAGFSLVGDDDDENIPF